MKKLKPIGYELINLKKEMINTSYSDTVKRALEMSVDQMLEKGFIDLNTQMYIKDSSVSVKDFINYLHEIETFKKTKEELAVEYEEFILKLSDEICELGLDKDEFYCSIDLDNNRLYIKEQVLNDKISKKLILTDILKTSKSNRVITIPDFLKNILQDHKPDYMINKVNDFVILSRNNTMCNPRNLSMDFTKNVAKYTKPIEELTNAPINYKQLLKLSFHDLRHTHATILLKHGENVKVISERLGHTSIKITLDTYSHVLPSMEEHTALLLNNIFKDKL